MLDSLEKIPPSELQIIDVFVLVVGDSLAAEGLQLSRKIRASYPDLGVLNHCGGGKYSSQLKRAFASGARLAVILEPETDAEGPLKNVKIRRLDDSGESITLEIVDSVGKIAEFLQNS